MDYLMNKSLCTNGVALVLIIMGFIPEYNTVLFMTGLFALSGSITNSLAIHMLFEKIPFQKRLSESPTKMPSDFLKKFLFKRHFQKVQKK